MVFRSHIPKGAGWGRVGLCQIGAAVRVRRGTLIGKYCRIIIVTVRLKEYIDTEYFNNFLETTFIRFPKNLIHCNNFQKIEKMILIADSGSTKTDWCLADETQTIAFKTAGINPFFPNR